MSKKILIFSIAYIPFVGGAELAVKEITDRISDIRWDMITLRFDKKHSSFEKIGNINIHRIRSTKLFFPFLAFFKAIKLHKKNSYDLIWSIMANRAGYAALFFKIIFPQSRFLLTLQEGDMFDYPRQRAGFLWLFVGFLFSRIFTKADYIQAISNYLANWAREMGFSREVEVVPNGVDIENFSRQYSEDELNELKNKLSKKENDKYLITTSRLVLKNAIEDIIYSLEYLPNAVKLLVLGIGPDLKRLQDFAKKFGLENRVMFLGQVSHKDMPKYLKISDIFIRPSLSEGLGSSFLEAMAAGIPVIATSVGGIPDFLKDGETGLFCQVRNPKSIAEGVKLLMGDEILRKKIVVNAKEMVVKNYDWNLIAERMKVIFDKLCAS